LLANNFIINNNLLLLATIFLASELICCIQKQISHNSYVGGTNKSNFVVNALTAEMVCVRRLLSCDLVYLHIGHSKTSMDQTFANISTSIDGKDLFNHLYATLVFSIYFDY
jgi:hypothetical protein